MDIVFYDKAAFKLSHATVQGQGKRELIWCAI